MKKLISRTVLILAATLMGSPAVADDIRFNESARFDHGPDFDRRAQIAHRSRSHRAFDRAFDRVFDRGFDRGFDRELGDEGGRFYQRAHGWFGWGNHWEVDADEQARIDGQIQRIGDAIADGEGETIRR
jgi:hypothetical protein